MAGGESQRLLYGVFPAVDDVYACGQSLCGVANVASVQVEHFHGLLVCGIVLDGLDAYAEQFLVGRLDSISQGVVYARRDAHAELVLICAARNGQCNAVCLRGRADGLGQCPLVAPVGTIVCIASRGAFARGRCSCRILNSKTPFASIFLQMGFCALFRAIAPRFGSS